MILVRSPATLGGAESKPGRVYAGRRRRGGFSLIELLVVAAMVALLTSFLLPTLKLVKESAREAVCAAHMQQLGLAAAAYTLEFDEYVPSPITVGWARAVSASYRDDILPTTVWDTFSSLLPYLGTEPAPTRIGRLKQTVSGVFRCPSNGLVSTPWCDDGIEGYDGLYTAMPGFLELGNWHAMSYGVPLTMLVAGESWRNLAYQLTGVDGFPYCQLPEAGAGGPVALAGVRLPGSYGPIQGKMGTTSSKIFLADGTRYVTASGAIRTDIGLEGRAHFATDGGWSRESHEYSDVGEYEGIIPRYRVSYRHWDGRGLNALFHDGRVEHLRRPASHYAGLWLPKDTIIEEDCGLADPRGPERYYLGPGELVP